MLPTSHTCPGPHAWLSPGNTGRAGTPQSRAQHSPGSPPSLALATAPSLLPLGAAPLPHRALIPLPHGALIPHPRATGARIKTRHRPRPFETASCFLQAPGELSFQPTAPTRPAAQRHQAPGSPRAAPRAGGSPAWAPAPRRRGGRPPGQRCQRSRAAMPILPAAAQPSPPPPPAVPCSGQRQAHGPRGQAASGSLCAALPQQFTSEIYPRTQD